MAKRENRNRGISLTLILLVVSPVYCQTKKNRQGALDAALSTVIAWRPQFAAAVAESGSSGQPVFVDFTADWCGYCKKLDANTFQSPELIRFVNANFIAVKVDVDREEGLSRRFEIKGMPTGLILNAAGEEVDRIVGYMEGDSYLARLREAMKKVGPAQPIAANQRVRNWMTAADRAYGNEQFGIAYSLYEKVIAESAESPDGEKAQKRRDEIVAAGQSRLEEAKSALDSKDYTAAAGLLTGLVRGYGGTPAADAAKGLESKLRGDAAAQTALRQAEAEQLYTRALADLRGDNFSDAMTRLRAVVDRYGELPIAAKASSELERMNRSPTIRQRAADQAAEAQSRIWLSLARTWAKNNRPRRANDFYRKVIETFPDSSYAETARTAIAQSEVVD